MSINKKQDLWIEDENFDHLNKQFNSAYQAWRTGKFGNGKWYVWFEHHAEMVLGIKCEVNYNRRTADRFEVVDEEKFMMFMLKYS